MRFCRRIGLLPVLVFALLLGACTAKPDETQYLALSEAHKAYCTLEKAEIGFQMEATFADASGQESGALYFTSGTAAYDRTGNCLWQKYTATVLGASVSAEDYFVSGVRTRVQGDTVSSAACDAEVFWGAFPYSILPLPAYDGIQSLEATESGANRMQYTLTCTTGQKELLEQIWKIDLYQLAGIRQPDTEKEQYGTLSYVFTVEGGKLRSVLVTLPVDVYEQAGYTPGYTPDPEDSCLHLTIRTSLTFKKIGSDVTVPLPKTDNGEA